MFNEILTGKATLEPPPAPVEPYREPSVPEVPVTCASCGTSFRVKVGVEQKLCARCNLAAAEANAAVQGATGGSRGSACSR